jgi:enoyl-CoA hydratase
MDFGGGDEIRFERIGQAGVVTLTRPSALNALTHGMVNALTAALEAWRHDASIALVLVKGEGRAFCAGGDLMAVYRSRGTGNPPVGFFADEYRLNAMIDGWPKPYVALIDGIVMGGGVGISGHGSHRVFTENAMLAMPEVGIGFFPDVGGSHILPHLGGWFGMYLALTGNRIRYGDALWSGLATHTMKAEYRDGLIERLAETGDPDLALREVFAPARRETDDATLHKIAKHFAGPTLGEIAGSLEVAAPDDEFARQTLETIRKRSPTSLHVAFREVAAGLTLSMAECMRMEFRILNRMLPAVRRPLLGPLDRLL